MIITFLGFSFFHNLILRYNSSRKILVKRLCRRTRDMIKISVRNNGLRRALS